MNLKKCLGILGSKKAQASLEYFIIFSIIAVLTILSFSSFFPRVQRAVLGGTDTTKSFLQSAAKRIIE